MALSDRGDPGALLSKTRHRPGLNLSEGVPHFPFTYPASFKKKHCTIIIIETGFCKDLGCGIKLAKKSEKYSPLIAVLKKSW
jgi:hypothetical protein